MIGVLGLLRLGAFQVLGTEKECGGFLVIGKTGSDHSRIPRSKVKFKNNKNHHYVNTTARERVVDHSTLHTKKLLNLKNNVWGRSQITPTIELQEKTLCIILSTQ